MPRILPEDHARHVSEGAYAKLTPEQRRSRSRLAALVQWSKTEDWTARTQAARDGLARKFEDQVDPDRRLDPAQRAKMAEAARRAHYTRLGRLSAKAKAAKKAGGDGTP
jgi:hypothetical protein